jgi:tetratricopeptide (TPR) repeat protein
MAARYYERATRLDPSYALAWAGLSRVRNWQVNAGFIPAKEGHRLARQTAERALALNPSLAAAQTQIGRIQQHVDFDLPGAVASFRRAIALEPGNSEAIRTASAAALLLGRFDEALRLNRRAVGLDPLNADSWVFLAQTEFWMGRLDEATADARRALQLNPDALGVHSLLSEVYVMQGRPQEALPEIEREQLAYSRVHLYAIAYHAMGRVKESEAALTELIAKYQSVAPYNIARVYAFRREPDQVFAWLDRAYAERDPGVLATRVDPLMKRWHDDPRYIALLTKLNLPN